MSMVTTACPICGEAYSFGVVGSTFYGGHDCPVETQMSEHWEKRSYRELWWCDPDGNPVKKADGIVPLLVDLANEPFLSTPEMRETAKRLITEADD